MINDSFSLRRVGMLYNFYSPAIRLILIISAAVVLGSYILCLYGAHMSMRYGMQIPFFLSYTIGSTAVGWIYYLGPFVLVGVKDRGITTVLPASWQEKSAFVLSWTFVLYPLFLAVMWYGPMALCSLFTDAANVNETMLTVTGVRNEGFDLSSLMNKSGVYNIAQNVMVASMTLFVIISSRRNRLAHGVAACIISVVALGLAGVAVGIFAGVKAAFAAKAGAEIDGQELVAYIFNSLKYGAWIVVAVAVMLVVASVWKIKNRQN